MSSLEVVLHDRPFLFNLFCVCLLRFLSFSLFFSALLDLAFKPRRQGQKRLRARLIRLAPGGLPHWLSELVGANPVPSHPSLHLSIDDLGALFATLACKPINPLQQIVAGVDTSPKLKVCFLHPVALASAALQLLQHRLPAPPVFCQHRLHPKLLSRVVPSVPLLFSWKDAGVLH